MLFPPSTEFGFTFIQPVIFISSSGEVGGSGACEQYLQTKNDCDHFNRKAYFYQAIIRGLRVWSILIRRLQPSQFVNFMKTIYYFSIIKRVVACIIMLLVWCLKKHCKIYHFLVDTSPRASAVYLSMSNFRFIANTYCLPRVYDISVLCVKWMDFQPKSICSVAQCSRGSNNAFEGRGGDTHNVM